MFQLEPDYGFRLTGIQFNNMGLPDLIVALTLLGKNNSDTKFISPSRDNTDLLRK